MTNTNQTKRPGWNHIFLLEAYIWSFRSHDPVTKCGCILVKNHTVLSTGYNGFIRNIDDNKLPNTRPEKYDYMIHAEHNAILNCARNGISTLNSIAYITAIPCNNCLQFMWQAGVKKIVYSDFSVPKMCSKSDFINKKERILKLMGNMEMVFIPSKKVLENFVLPNNKTDKIHTGEVL